MVQPAHGQETEASIYPEQVGEHPLEDELDEEEDDEELDEELDEEASPLLELDEEEEEDEEDEEDDEEGLEQVRNCGSQAIWLQQVGSPN